MRVSRGQFLSTCSAAIVGATLERGVSSAVPLDIGHDGSHLGAGEFRQHLGTEFRVDSRDDRPRRLVLTQVADRSVDRRIEQFSALFEGRGSGALEDGTYQFHHRALGQLALFIVVVGIPSSECVTYEACFSRIRG